MRFEEALKAMRAGKEVKLNKSTGTFFMKPHITKNGKTDIRIYYKSADGKCQRVTHFGVRYLTMLEWEIVDDKQ